MNLHHPHDQAATAFRRGTVARSVCLLAVLTAWFASSPIEARAELRFASLGDFHLENSDVIRDCKIGYRTFGTLNADRSNVILFPTWFTGHTKDLVEFMAADGMVDISKYYVVAVDALGNGISSSPSNSAKQGRQAFPRFSTGDMVRSQHKLLTEELGIAHLHAVMGISMGGMQTFEWIVTYPEFMDKAIPIIGSPRLAAYDLLLWRTELNVIEAVLEAYTDPSQQRRIAMKLANDVQQLALTSPGRFNADVGRDQLEVKMASTEAETIKKMGPYDWASQLRAMIGHDVARRFGGKIELAAQEVEADVLVISAVRDHMVTPGPSFDFAGRVKARTFKMESDCGHLSFQCQAEEVKHAVREFLAE